MRKLMWFTLGFGVATALCAYLWLIERLWIVAMILLAAVPLMLLSDRSPKWLRCGAMVCLGAAVGLLWFQLYAAAYLAPVVQLDGKMVSMDITCSDYCYKTDYGSAVEGYVILEGKPVRVKVYLDKEMHAEPGDLLRGTFKFRITTPGGAEEVTAHRGKGIFLLAYQKDNVQILKPERVPRWTFPARLRQNLLNALELHFPVDTAGFAKALLLGDRTGIDYRTNTAFKLSGISHVIAVSGLHVTILFTLINVFFLKRRWLVAFFGIPVLVLFAAVAGFSPSITRACIMQCLMIVATVLDREYDGPTELAFSCLVMMFANPLVITSVSFQLSVGCMIGIFLFGRRISEYLTGKYLKKNARFLKTKRWMIGSVSVTLSAMVFTTPLVAYYFGAISLVGVLTNLLTLWIISFIFYGILLVCLLSMCLPAVAAVAAWIIAWPIRYVLAVSKIFAAFPLSAVYTTSKYIVLWLLFCYILLVVFSMRKKKRIAFFVCCVICSLCISISVSWLLPMRDGVCMTVLDAGQGQCILLQSEGRAYLVDCGGSNGEELADSAAELLLSQGIFHLDGLILTHFDKDHSSGAEYLLSRVQVDALIVPFSYNRDEILDRLSPLTLQTVTVKENLLIAFGDSELLVFGPIVMDSSNENSLAILFHRENCDILITGDRSALGERLLLKTVQLPDVDILVAGHHGSKNSSCQELLDVVKPEIVVISVGENNYGHPAKEALDRFAAIGAAVYRTDQQGTIIFRR